MTNNPLPAALASIRRYDLNEAQDAIIEHSFGDYIRLQDVLATLAVTDEMVGRALYAAARFVDPGFTSRDRMRAALIAAYAAPPADSAMGEALQACVDSLAGYRREMNDTQPCDAETRARTLLAGRK